MASGSHLTSGPVVSPEVGMVWDHELVPVSGFKAVTDTVAVPVGKSICCFTLQPFLWWFVL